MDHDPQALPPGTVIAGYRIVRVLGAGGFGITYEGHSAVANRRVAIKEFFPRGIASREGATRLVYATRDAEIVKWALGRFESSTAELCRLRHPSIVRVYHYVMENGTGYMIMEYVEGSTLDSWLRERASPPTPAELAPVIDPILDALDYVHGTGRIHRDIAPDNIMIRPDGRPVLIDFGAVKAIEQRTRTVQSFMVAKANYSPPEQTQDGADLDRTADVYAVGAVLYRAFAGEPPVDAEKRKNGILLKGADPYRPIGEAAGVALPAAVTAMIDRALAFHCHDRIQTIAEIRATLQSKDKDGETPQTLPRAPVTEPIRATTTKPQGASGSQAFVAPRPPRRFPITALAGIAAVVAIAGLGFADPFGWFKPKPPDDPRPALEAREEKIYRDAAGDVVKLEAYISQCSACRFKAEAQRAVIDIRARDDDRQRREAEERTFRAAAGDAAKLEAYINQCRTCQFKAEARQAVAALARERNEDRARREAEERRTFEAADYDDAKLRDYLDRCAICAFSQDARDRRARVEAERKEFDAAGNDRARLEAYLRSCVACLAKAEGESRLAALRPIEAPAKPEDRTIVELNEAILLNPKNANAIYRRGQIFAGRREFKRALDDFDQALRLNPSDPEAFNDRCWVRAVIGQLQEALADCNEALRLRPNFVDALDSRGFAHLKLNQLDRAIADYDRVLRMNARQTSSLYGRGKAKLKNGDRAGGNADVAAAREMKPEIAEEFASYGVQ